MSRKDLNVKGYHDRSPNLLEKEGADALHISACNAALGLPQPSPLLCGRGRFRSSGCEAVKSEVEYPGYYGGQNTETRLLADQIIQDEKADLVSMGRALIADPHLPRKGQRWEA